MTTEYSYSQDPMLMGLIAGRNLDEQLEYIKKFGSHGLAAVLRAGVLKSIGLPPAKATAQNAVLFGCYQPFSYAAQVRDYMKLLDILGVDYTYLDKEVCCGSPMIQSNEGEERERAKANSRGFVRTNTEMAEKKGAKRFAYFCIGCAQMVPGLLPEERERHVYSIDLLLDAVQGRKMKVPPAVVGYFEGCHTRYRRIFPDVALRWADYRKLLDRVEGLKVVDLPATGAECCSKHPEKTIEAAEKQNLSTIVCSCNGCFRRLDNAAAGKVQVKHLPQILLQAVQYQ